MSAEVNDAAGAEVRTADGGAGGSVVEGRGFESPPAAPVPERREFDPRARLHELAVELVRTRNRRLLMEYLRLRRVVR